MQVVIPIIAQIDHSELRFCLRSLEKFLDDFEVTVIGPTIPDWITGVEQIELADIPGRKQLNIKRKIMAALHLYDEIFYLADDVYLLKQCVANKFPYIFNGELVKRNKEGSATRLKQQLIEMGKTFLNFDCHYPVVYRKDFLNIMQLFQPDVIVKSAYCNYLAVPGVQKKDAKIITQLSTTQVAQHCTGLPAFSSGDHSFKWCRPYLQQLFPEISRFEVYE